MVLVIARLRDGTGRYPYADTHTTSLTEPHTSNETSILSSFPFLVLAVANNGSCRRPIDVNLVNNVDLFSVKQEALAARIHSRRRDTMRASKLPRHLWHVSMPLCSDWRQLLTFRIGLLPKMRLLRRLHRQRAESAPPPQGSRPGSTGGEEASGERGRARKRRTRRVRRVGQGGGGGGDGGGWGRSTKLRWNSINNWVSAPWTSTRSRCEQGRTPTVIRAASQWRRNSTHSADARTRGRGMHLRIEPWALSLMAILRGDAEGV